MPVEISSSEVAKAANNDFLSTASAETAPKKFLDGAEEIIEESKVKIPIESFTKDTESFNKDKPEPVANHNRVSSCCTISPIELLFNPLN